VTGLVVEQENRHAGLTKVAGGPGATFSIGRGYACDLVVTDPYVAPVQVVLRHVDGHWQLEAMDVTNPVLVDGHAVGHAPVVLSDKARVTIGRTRLTLVAENAPVPPTRRLAAPGWLGLPPHGLFGILALLAALAGLDATLDYVQTSTTLDWQQFAFVAVYSVLVVTAWAGLWSGVGQVLRHHAQFRGQLKATTLVFALAIVAFNLMPFVQYPLASASFDFYIVGWLLSLSFVALLLKQNLHIATNLSRPGLVAVVLVFGLGGLSVAWTRYLEKEVLVTNPRYPATVKPPFARIGTARDSATFLGDVERTFDRLADKRAED